MVNFSEQFHSPVCPVQQLPVLPGLKNARFGGLKLPEDNFVEPGDL